MQIHQFNLLLENQNNLIPFVVGSCKELGAWNCSKGIPLKKQRTSKNSSQELWSVDIPIETSNVDYKYFLSALNSENVEVVVLETFDRKLSNKMAKEEFGIFNDELKIGQPRLEDKFDYKLKVFHPPTFETKNDEIKECFMKCDILKKDGEVLPHRLTTISLLNGQSKSPVLVPDAGVFVSFNNMFMLNVRTILSKIILKFSFHAVDENKEPKKDELAYAYVQLGVAEEGKTDLFMTTPNGKLMAVWSMSYLIVRPLSNQSTVMRRCKSDGNFSKPLYIGHRGHGTTFDKNGHRVSPYLENTMQSFRAAYDKGIRTIEFDVMLSKDNIPVVYHDFKTHLRVKTGSSELKVEIPIQHLKYNDLINNQFQISRDSKNIYDEHFYEKNKLFSKLEHLFLQLPEDLCFDVEIKYSMELETGGMEDDNHSIMSKNEYVDTILKVCFDFVKDRFIFFSSFDPDVCAMLKSKQDHFPVMLISQGKCFYEPYCDPRSKTLEDSIHFAAAEQLFGVVLHTDPLLRQKELVTQAHQMGLMVYVWGEKNNEKEMLKELADLKVDGIALDNLDIIT